MYHRESRLYIRMDRVMQSRCFQCYQHYGIQACIHWYLDAARADIRDITLLV